MKVIKEDAFLKKLLTVYTFEEKYLKNNCFLEFFILEDENKSNHQHALVRIFIDLDKNEIPYAIFINKENDIIFVDLIAGDEKTVENHPTKTKSFVSGVIKNEGGIIILTEEDTLAAALLNVAEIKNSSNPSKELEENLRKLIDPVII